MSRYANINNIRFGNRDRTEAVIDNERTRLMKKLGLLIPYDDYNNTSQSDDILKLKAEARKIILDDKEIPKEMYDKLIEIENRSKNETN